MRRFFQFGIAVQRLAPGVRRPGQWTGKSVKRIAVECGPLVMLVEWSPWWGVYPLGLYRERGGAWVQTVTYPPMWRVPVKRRSVLGGEGVPVPALSGETAVLKKFPRLVEFLTAVYYDDGTARQTGQVWLRVEMTAFVMTLIDKDACCKMVVRAAALDDLMATAEKLLGSDAAVWEIDQYALDRAQQKKRKK